MFSFCSRFWGSRDILRPMPSYPHRGQLKAEIVARVAAGETGWKRRRVAAGETGWSGGGRRRRARRNRASGIGEPRCGRRARSACRLTDGAAVPPMGPSPLGEEEAATVRRARMSEHRTVRRAGA